MQVDKEAAIMVRDREGTMQLTPQDNQLMSEHRILRLKPHLRLEWRGQDGQSETEQPDHSASLGDSITSSTRIRFSVHTGARIALQCFPRGCWSYCAIGIASPGPRSGCSRAVIRSCRSPRGT